MARGSLLRSEHVESRRPVYVKFRCPGLSELIRSGVPGSSRDGREYGNGTETSEATRSRGSECVWSLVTLTQGAGNKHWHPEPVPFELTPIEGGRFSIFL